MSLFPENIPVSIALGRNWCNPQLVMAAVGCAVMMSERNDREVSVQWNLQIKVMWGTILFCPL